MFQSKLEKVEMADPAKEEMMPQINVKTAQVMDLINEKIQSAKANYESISRSHIESRIRPNFMAFWISLHQYIDETLDSPSIGLVQDKINDIIQILNNYLVNEKENVAEDLTGHGSNLKKIRSKYTTFFESTLPSEIEDIDIMVKFVLIDLRLLCPECEQQSNECDCNQTEESSSDDDCDDDDDDDGDDDEDDDGDDDDDDDNGDDNNGDDNDDGEDELPPYRAKKDGNVSKPKKRILESDSE